jgi:hypothetical protein
MDARRFRTVNNATLFGLADTKGWRLTAALVPKLDQYAVVTSFSGDPPREQRFATKDATTPGQKKSAN